MRRIIFASKNEGKVEEVRYIFNDLKLEIISLSDVDFKGEIIESGNTFEENAMIKAAEIYDKYKIEVIADDSGLVVEQLNGEPGIYSARYAGSFAKDRENNEKLLNKLKSFPEPHRAKYFCAAVYFKGKEKYSAPGEVEGVIINEERGSMGFGYDPLFIPDGYDKTMAELEYGIKNKISHRYNAFSKLKNILRSNTD